jgi:DNA-binding Lrp family transcriptional regulator
VRVVFHVISTGGGAGASRVTRYIAERDKDPEREGPGPRPLFSEDREGMSYRTADGVLDPEGHPQKDDLLHLTVSFEEADFEKLGADEKERQARLRELVRDGIKGMAEELNVERLTWVAGIHRNTDNPHAHIVVHKQAIERATGKEKRIGRIPRQLLPHKEMQEGREVLVPGPLGDRFLSALEKQQALYLSPEHPRAKARSVMDLFLERERTRAAASGHDVNHRPAVDSGKQPSDGSSSQEVINSLEKFMITRSWTEDREREGDYSDMQILLGRRLELSMRLTFAETWHERAVEHGDTFRFDVIDQSTSAERKISDLDVHRRASARAYYLVDRTDREAAYKTDLCHHQRTLQDLSDARKVKIAKLEAKVQGLGEALEKLDARLAPMRETNTAEVAPIISRITLAKLQDEAVKLNLPAAFHELENGRLALAREHNAPARTDEEARALMAQFNVARADYLAREKRFDNFEASVHLVNYEVGDERWSLAGLDKEIKKRREDTKIIPERAARLDLRALARINYLPRWREAAAREVERLTEVREEVLRQIELRREELSAARDLARELSAGLESAYTIEERSREQNGRSMPNPKYNEDHVKTLEASAEILRDTKLLSEVHEWEKTASKHDPNINWQGRALAREIMADVGAKETAQRLDQFLESKKVVSLHLGNHRTGTLREVEARTLTDYLARAIQTTTQRDYRNALNLAAKEHHGRLEAEFEKASEYHDAARELASAATSRYPKFTDKEKMNLEIYAERQMDPQERERFLGLAREGRGNVHDRQGIVSRSR